MRLTVLGCVSALGWVPLLPQPALDCRQSWVQVRPWPVAAGAAVGAGSVPPQAIAKTVKNTMKLERVQALLI